MQGYPLGIVAYNIGVLTLIKRLKAVYPDVTQPWYIDDAGELGTFNSLEIYFNSLKCNGLTWRYYPKTTNIILIVHPGIIEARELFGAHHGFKVCTGANYVGVYIGDDESKGACIKNRTDKWDRNIHVVTETVGKYPQKRYSAVAHMIQSE